MLETSPPPEMSAAHRVLSIPTLLSEIFSFISLDESRWNACPNIDDPTLTWSDHECKECARHGAFGVLARCAQVNKYWFSEAVRILWKQPFVFRHNASTTLSAHMARIAPERRQQYANWIVEGTEYSLAWPDEKREGVLENLSFPRLHTVSMALNGDWLPKMLVEKVEFVELDPYYEPYGPEVWGMNQDAMDVVFDFVATSFPNAREVCILDRCLVHVGGVKKFVSKMKKLEYMGSEPVVEMEGEP